MSAGGNQGGGYDPRGVPPGAGGYGPPQGQSGQGQGVGAPPGGGWGAQPGGGSAGGYGPPPQGGYPPPGWGPQTSGFAPMPANLPPGYVPSGATENLQGGVPWEQKGGSFLTKWWSTVKACNNETRPFFAAASQNESGDAITFAMVSGAVSGAFIGLLYVILFSMLSAGILIGMPALSGSRGGSPAMSGLMAGFSIGIGIFYALIITASSAVGAVMRAFVWGGIHHVLLMLFGGIGERKTFMHTVRVVAYAEGASVPWIWIPIAGPFIALFFGIKDIVVGYDETHRCGVGKAILVLFAPVLCCCICNLVFVLLGFLPFLGRP